MTNEVRLTSRMCGIAQAIMCGMYNKEIASFYKTTPQTVKNQITEAMRRTGTRSRLELGLWWWRYAIAGHEEPHYVAGYAVNAHAARMKSAEGDGVTKLQWFEILRKYDYRCLNCGTSERVCRDHVVPLSRGGLHDVSNIQPLCVSCNSKKGTKTIDYRTF